MDLSHHNPQGTESFTVLLYLHRKIDQERFKAAMYISLIFASYKAPINCKQTTNIKDLGVCASSAKKTYKSFERLSGAVMM